MAAPLKKIADSLYRNKHKALLLWLVGLAIVIVPLSSQVRDLVKVGGYSLPGTEFNVSASILRDKLGISADKTALVIFNSPTLRVYDPGFEDEVVAALHRLEAHPLIQRTETFYETGVPDYVSKDNHTLYAILYLQGSEEEIEKATPEFRELARSDTLEVSVTGILAANYDIEKATAEDLNAVEVFTIPLVLIILFVFLRGILIGLVPIVIGAVTILITLAIVAAIAFNTDVSIFAINISTMIGLGLSIDFSLIILDRFKSELRNSTGKEAAANTLDTAGRSILLSGITLFMTMVVWALFPVMIIRSIAIAISISAVVAVFTALCFLPVILAYIAPRLERRVRSSAMRKSGRGWQRFSLGVMRFPWVSLAVSLGVLLVLASPLREMQRRGVTLEVVPPSVESRYGGDLLAAKYGEGAIGPIMVVVETPEGEIWNNEVMQGVFDLHQAISADPRVDRVRSLMSIIPNPSSNWATSLSQLRVTGNPDYYRLAKRFVDVDAGNSSTVLLVFPKANEVNPDTVALLQDIRANILNWAPSLAGVQVYTGGAPAMHYDFGTVVDSQIPIYFTLTLLVNFLTLVVIFKSILIPIKAVLTNLLTLMASFGVLVMVFQYGWGLDFLHAENFGSVTFYTPVVGFAILYGLSTDYEVFLMSRIREQFAGGLSNADSVAAGVQESARVITTAGLIMIVVFGSFAFTQVLVTKELGVVLAVAIFLDMTIVRLVLVPASMKLMGDFNWWIPRRLDRLLPEIRES